MLCFRCIRYFAAKLRKKTKTCTIITGKNTWKTIRFHKVCVCFAWNSSDFKHFLLKKFCGVGNIAYICTHKKSALFQEKICFADYQDGNLDSSMQLSTQIKGKTTRFRRGICLLSVEGSPEPLFQWQSISHAFFVFCFLSKILLFISKCLFFRLMWRGVKLMRHQNLECLKVFCNFANRKAEAALEHPRVWIRVICFHWCKDMFRLLLDSY